MLKLHSDVMATGFGNDPRRGRYLKCFLQGSRDLDELLNVATLKCTRSRTHSICTYPHITCTCEHTFPGIKFASPLCKDCRICGVYVLCTHVRFEPQGMHMHMPNFEPSDHDKRPAKPV